MRVFLAPAEAYGAYFASPGGQGRSTAHSTLGLLSIVAVPPPVRDASTGGIAWKPRTFWAMALMFVCLATWVWYK